MLKKSIPLKWIALGIALPFVYLAYLILMQPWLFRTEPGKSPIEPRWSEHHQIVVLHDIGLQRDRSRAWEAVRALQSSDEQVHIQALWALARLELRETLPAIEKLAQVDQASPETAYARVVAARIKTTPDTPAKDSRELRRQMKAFLWKAWLPPIKIAYYARHPYARNRIAWHQSHYAIQQLADMALVASQRGVANAASASPVNLTRDPGAKLKAELCGMPARQRIPRLVETLADGRLQGVEELYTMQALINEGQPALPVVLAKLQAMRRDPKYSPAGYNALFNVLAGLGGPEATATVASFCVKGAHGKPRHVGDNFDVENCTACAAAQAYRDLARGDRIEQVLAY